MASNTAGRQLFRDLVSGTPPKPILLIYGEESFLVEEAIRAVVKCVLPEGGDDFSNQVFEASETSGVAVRQALETFSLFGGKRVIHLRGVGAMKPEELDALLGYLDRPADDAVLLMSDRSLDMRKKFFKTVKSAKSALTVEFKPLYANELPDWVVRRARGKGLTGVDRDIAELIAEWTGPALASMNSALDKLALYASREGNGGGQIDDAAVRQVLDDTRARTVFELTKQLGGGQLAGSLDALERMLARGESAVGILSMVTRHFRIVWKVREGLHAGVRGRDLARQAGCPPMFLREYEGDARRFDGKRLQLALAAIHDAERALKSSPLDDRIVMSNLLLSVCLGTPTTSATLS